MRKSNIWIIEDDKSCQYVYQLAFAEKYDFRFFENLRDFVNTLGREDGPDLVIADLMLHESTFLDFFALPESDLLECELIVVSSIDDLETLRECYEGGALDYLTKPFNKNELLAKVERACTLRAPRVPAANLQRVAERPGFQLDPRQLRISVSGKWADLTRKEYQILDAFQQAANGRTDKDTLLKKIWNDVKVGRKTLDVHLFHLRKKLKPMGLSIVFEPPGAYKLSTPEPDKLMQ